METQTKKLKCMNCGRESIVGENIIMEICPACQIEMEEREEATNL